MLDECTRVVDKGMEEEESALKQLNLADQDWLSRYPYN